MASTRRKSAAIALAVVGVAGLSLASAAQLNVDSASLGAATEIVASCQPEGGAAIEVGFQNSYASGAYNTTGIVLTGVAAACDGLDVRVTLADETGAALHEFTGTAATGTTTLATPTGSELAADVESVSVVISG